MTIGKMANGKTQILWYGYRRNVTREPYVKKRVVLSQAMFEELVQKILINSLKL